MYMLKLIPLEQGRYLRTAVKMMIFIWEKVFCSKSWL